MAAEDSWEARMAARARARQPAVETRDSSIGRKCAVCGFESPHSLRYGNLKTGAAYCSEEHLKQDPDWSDDIQWMAGGGSP